MKIKDRKSGIDNLTIKFNDYDTSTEVDSKISEAVAAANHLSYKTVETIGDIDLTETQYIYLVKNGEVYDEYMIVNGKLEKVGDWNTDLSDYAKKSEVKTVADDLATTKETVLNIVTRVEALESISTTVENLASQLNSVNTKVQSIESTIADHTTQINELQIALDKKADLDDLEEFKEAMSWKNLSDVE